MPRDVNGNYVPPAGNPVQSGTTITADWANTIVADLGNEITGSLSRNGQGGMLSPLLFDDGIPSAPGVTFTNEPTMGMYRESAGVLAFSGGKFGVVRINATNELDVLRNGAHRRVVSDEVAGSTAQQKLPNGSFPAPAVAFTSELTNGLYRPDVGEVGLSAPTLRIGDTVADQTLRLGGINNNRRLALSANGALDSSETAHINIAGNLVSTNPGDLRLTSGTVAGASVVVSAQEEFSVSTTAGVIRLETSGIGQRIVSMSTVANTISSPANLHISAGGQIYTSTSSRQFKTDERPIENPEAVVMALKPVTYEAAAPMVEAGQDPGTRRYAGFVTEDVAEAFPVAADGLNYDDRAVLSAVTACLQNAVRRIEALEQ